MFTMSAFDDEQLSDIFSIDDPEQFTSFDLSDYTGIQDEFNNLVAECTALSGDEDQNADFLVGCDEANTKSATVPKKFACSDCEKSYTQHRSLKRHIITTHPLAAAELAKEKSKKFKYKCDRCNLNFNKLYHLQFHIRRVHAELPAREEKRHRCILCCESFPKRGLFAHYEAEHNVIMETETLHFPNFEEFNSWKLNMEKETKSKFNLERGSRQNGNTKRSDFVCHRSGTYHSRSHGARRLKTQGSYKINCVCPSNIKLTEDENGNCSVLFMKTHVGHQNDIGHLSLSLVERQSIAAKIAAKLPFDVILDDIRDSTSGQDRMFLLSRRDLYNIENSYNLTSAAVRHRNSETSVDAWVNEMRSFEAESCVLFYKSQGTICETHPELKECDFVLIIMNEAQREMLKKYGSDCICIDGTRGVNAYGFELITLLILDDMRQGFPGAFLISNRTDPYTLSIFFSCIKQKVGKLTAEVFMSDMAESFFYAWILEMGIPEKRLYSTWQVDYGWRENLNRIIGKDKQIQTYKTLQILQTEYDKTAFEALLRQVLNMLYEDPDTAQYASYFEDRYLKNVAAWARCHRLQDDLSANIHMERMHKTLKHIYLHGKHTEKLDKSINAIMGFVRDKLVDRLEALHEGKASTKLKAIKKRHKASCNLEAHVTENENGWTFAFTKSNELHVVQEIDKDCSCRLICTECKTCIHRYSCTCADSAIKWNMCKHIHFACKIRNSMETPEMLGTDDISLSVEAPRREEDSVAASASLNARQENLKEKYLAIINSLSSMSDCDLFEKHLKSFKPASSAMQERKKSTVTLVKLTVPDKTN